MKTRVTRIHVKGYRSLADITLDPDAVTVLIGPNGSGKSNLLSLLNMVPLMRTKSLRNFVGTRGGASALLHFGPRTTKTIELSLEFEEDGARNCYRARLGYSAGDAFSFLDEEVGYQPPGGSWRYKSLGAGHRESILADAPGDDKTTRRLHWLLGSLTFFHFHDTSFSSPLRSNSRAQDVSYLRSDGSNLAAYLGFLRDTETRSARAAWRRINHLVRRVCPFIKELRPTVQGVLNAESFRLNDPSQDLGRATVRLDWIDERDHVFGPHHLSDGSLRAIALITALAQPTANLPQFITIDEPELGLHPTALGILVGLVRSVSHRTQVVLATQSAQLLDLFEPAEVVVAELREGSTVLRRLSSDALQSWLKDYTLSEIYAKNLIGGQP